MKYGGVGVDMEGDLCRQNILEQCPEARKDSLFRKKARQGREGEGKEITPET